MLGWVGGGATFAAGRPQAGRLFFFCARRKRATAAAIVTPKRSRR